MSHDPYREQTAETGERLRVFPGLSIPILVLMLVISGAPALLHLFLWSRVVEIRCERARTSVTCDVDENALAGSNHARVEVANAQRAQVSGSVYQTRGDAWIEVVTATSTEPLTRGFNLAKQEQEETAARLTAFFHDDSPRFDASFGSRWATSPVVLLGFAAVLVLYLLFGVRVTFLRRERLGALNVEVRRWPLPGRHLGFDLRDVRGVELAGDPKSRVHAYRHGENVCIRLVSGDLVRLALVTGRGSEELRTRLDTFVKRGRT